MPRANEIVKGKDLPDKRNFVLNNVAGQTVLSPFIISGTSVVLRFVDTNAEDFEIQVDGDIMSIVNLTGPITYIRFRGAANDDIQVDRPIVFNSTVTLPEDITLSGASPSITFTDTGGDDFSITVDANVLTILNITQGDTVVMANNPIVNITPAGASDTSFRITVDNQTSSGIANFQVVDNNNGTTNLVIRGCGETRSAAGYPTNLSDVPAKTITFGGQYDQDVTATGNVGGGTDTIASHTIDAFTLAQDGDSLQGSIGGLYAANANTKQIVASFGGTAFFDSTALAKNGGGWDIFYEIGRRSNSVVIVNWMFHVNSGSGNEAYGRSTVITGLDLTTNNTLLITGAATANDDVTCEFSSVRKFARAQ